MGTSTDSEILKLKAQIANLQRRHARESEFIRDEAQAKALTVLVEALEELSRARSHRPQDQDLAAMERSMTSKARSAGLVPVTCGAGFDPLIHESLQVRHIPGIATGTIVEIVRTGWRYRDRLIRPALVVVNQWEKDDD